MRHAPVRSDSGAFIFSGRQIGVRSPFGTTRTGERSVHEPRADARKNGMEKKP
jgi:hypothetical protein